VYWHTGESNVRTSIVSLQCDVYCGEAIRREAFGQDPKELDSRTTGLSYLGRNRYCCIVITWLQSYVLTRAFEIVHKGGKGGSLV